MNENPIFDPQQGIPQQQTNDVLQPSQANQQIPGGANYSSGFSFGSILKPIIGGVILLIIGIILFTIVIPKIFQKPNTKVTLTYWGLWEDKAVFTPLISEFQKQYPHITINYKKEDIKDYRERLVTRIDNGTGPDIFRFHNTWVPQLSNYLLAFPSDIVLKEEFQKYYFPVIQNDVVRNGKIFGIPRQVDTLALFVNEQLLQAGGINVPTDWNQFADAARKATVVDPATNKILKSGAALGTFDNISHASDILSLLFVHNGVNLEDLSSSTNVNLVADALKFYVSFSKGGGSTWDQAQENSTIAFAKGDVLLYFGYSWDIFTIKAINPSLPFSVHSVPHTKGTLPSQDIKRTIASYWVEGVSAKSKYSKEAFLFAKFLLRKENLQKLYTEQSKTRLFGELYPRSDLAETLKANTLIFPFAQQAQDATSTYFASDTYDNNINTKSNAYLGNAVRAMLGNTSAETAASDLAKGINQVFGRQ